MTAAAAACACAFDSSGPADGADASTGTGATSGEPTSPSGNPTGDPTAPSGSVGSGPGVTSDSDPTGDGPTGDDSTGVPDLDGSWVTLAPLPDGVRQDTAVVAHGGRVWVIGGHAGLPIVARMEVYDPAGDDWNDRAEVPVAGHGMNAASVDGRIIVAGMLTDDAGTVDGRVWSYHPGMNAWTEQTAMPGAGLAASGVAVLGDRMFVLGGVGGSPSESAAFIYDAPNDSWDSIADLPEALDHVSAFGADGLVYIAGGRSGGTDGHTAEVHVYDPGDDTWTAVASMPTSRAGMAAGYGGGIFYAAGGEGNPDESSGVFASFEAYLPASDTWQELTPMPVPRYGTGGVVIDGVFYVPGGGTLTGLGATDIHQAWIPQ